MNTAEDSDFVESVEDPDFVETVEDPDLVETVDKFDLADPDLVDTVEDSDLVDPVEDPDLRDTVEGSDLVDTEQDNVVQVRGFSKDENHPFLKKKDLNINHIKDIENLTSRVTEREMPLPKRHSLHLV